jgi:hypothetical protein
MTMQRELGDFMDLVATLEQSAGRLVPQVMETQILDSQQVAGPRERSTDALGVKGEYEFARLGLCGHKRPGLGRVFEPPVVPILVCRVLGVPDHAGPGGLVVVAPLQAADLGLSPGRGDGEIHNDLHGDLRAPVAPLEVLAQPGKFVVGRSPIVPFGLADQPQLTAGRPRLLHDLGNHRKLPDALGSSQNDADPDQIVDHGRGAGTLRTARLYMSDQVRGGEGMRNGLAERMPLQELQMGLLASLPARNRLEGIDVPADQFCEGRGDLPQPSQLRRVFERNLAMPGPTHGCRAVGKCPAFPMQDLPLATQPDYGRVACGSVALLACLDRWHDRNSGET